MKTLTHTTFAPAMVLDAKKARDLMTPNPVSIRHDATIGEVEAFLARRGISAAPVIDRAGRPVGVVSRTDIFHHRGHCAEPDGVNNATVRDVMTPGVLCVAPDTAAAKVVEKMVALKVRRMFVVDADGILVGVVSAVDVLRQLSRWGFTGAGPFAADKSRRSFELHTAN